jgi:hypothetical protein
MIVALYFIKETPKTAGLGPERAKGKSTGCNPVLSET